MTTERVLSIFLEITTIPRESGHEEKIIEYLKNFAIKHNLAHQVDEAGNVLIVKEASAGMEKLPVIILQSHSDMVCEKNSGVVHDFSKDPIKVEEIDGWLVAKETTLGADCGIGIAAQLAILEDKNLKTGKIECLFTTAEETGLDGAKALKPGFLTGSILINLDSEDEGELFVGCAGGIDTTAKFNYTPEADKKEKISFKVGFKGGLGGHSGDDIDKNRANAVQLLGRLLYKLSTVTDTFSLGKIDGGNKRNAIARESFAEISVDAASEKEILTLCNDVFEGVADEYASSDPEMKGYVEKIEQISEIIPKSTALPLISVLNSVPHGVLAMSNDIAGLVETSSNLASIKIVERGLIRIGTSQRSSVTSARRWAAERIEAAFRNAGAVVTHESEYPGWKPKMDSPILKVCEKAYIDLFGNSPVVRAIHAGLECGLFLDIYPQLDMISFGPTIRGVHAPGEKLEIASVEKFVKLLEKVIVSI